MQLYFAGMLFFMSPSPACDDAQVGLLSIYKFELEWICCWENADHNLFDLFESFAI